MPYLISFDEFPSQDIVTDFSTSDGDRIVTTLAYRMAADAAGSALADFAGGGPLTLQGITAAAVQIGRSAA
jgi:hypothetical protein